MRNSLAERILVKLMSWSQEEIYKEISYLQAMAAFKYNEYQQFTPGMKFLESLARWLKQFNNLDEKEIAYDFVKNRLVFINSDQISFLINICFSSLINPIIIQKTAGELGIDYFRINRIVKSEEYKRNFRTSLFIGLSDGARIDHLRRCSGLNNEQVHPTYQISDSKTQEFLKDLQNEYHGCKFKTIFLIDDFTGSGKSYFRNEEDKQSGKMFKFLSSLFIDNRYDDLIDKSNLDLHILFYVATKEAKECLEFGINKWQLTTKMTFNYKIHVLQLLEPHLKDDIIKDKKFVDFLIKYFDNSIVDSHYEKGKHNKPYFGFDECGLPLVLVHNTPNNSFPILWFPEDKTYQGLFPRITRHRDE